MQTEVKSVRLSDATRAQIEQLGRRWGPVKPLSLAEVLRECVKRVHEQETSTKLKVPTSSGKQEKRR